MRLAAPNLELDLANAGVHFGAYVAGWGGTAPPTNWVGSHVVMRGVCGVRFNAERQLLGLVIHVPGQEYLGFGEPPPDDPFDRPVAPVADLLRFTSSGNQDALVKVNGVTTHNRGGWLGLQDASGGLLLRVSTNITVTPGQQIEVLGFPSPGDFTPTLEQPVFRALGPAEMPEPADASPRDLATGAMNGRLVRVQGRLVEQIGLQRRLWLTLSDQGLVFQVRVARDRTDRRPLLYRRNSLLEVVGVCQVVADAWQQPRAVRLWVNGPEDVRVVEAPPWLQVRHVALAGGGLLVVALGALLWVRALRRKVGEQTAELRRRYEAETALKEQFRGLFENAGDLIFTLDPEGRFLSLNQAAERVFGQDREALVGKPVAALLAKEDVSRLESALARLRNDGSVEPLEVRLGEGVGPATSAGAIIELNLQSIRREGALTGFQAIGRDRIEQHHLEAQVRQMQRVESVGRLAGGVAHDFNNVLAVILGNTEMALQNLPEGSPLHEQLQEINQAARRSADLTRQLLAFARRQTVQPRVVDLNEVVASMLKMLQRLIGEDVELLWLPGKDLPRVKIDPAQVDQILANLAVNARDAISGVGKLTIATSRITADESFQAAHPGLASGDYVRLEVADTGHGMDEETRAHIFEPFYTTKETGQGTGLGLATVHGIVQQNQGWIDVDSRPGQGTAFAIYLPAAAEATRSQAADAQPASPAEPAAEARGNETILMVEDEPSVLKPARIILESRGYTVLAATTPSEALRLAAEHAGEIRLLISDVVMPEMNGRELQERVATLCPHLRTLFISGYTRDVIARQGVIEEGVDFLSKPFSLKGLAAKVRSMLDQPPRPGNGSASATDQAGEVGVAETTGETPPKG